MKDERHARLQDGCYRKSLISKRPLMSPVHLVVQNSEQNLVEKTTGTFTAVPAMESFHHCIRIFPGVTFPRTVSLIAAVSTLKALMASAAGLLFQREQAIDCRAVSKRARAMRQHSTGGYRVVCACTAVERQRASLSSLACCKGQSNTCCCCNLRRPPAGALAQSCAMLCGDALVGRHTP